MAGLLWACLAGLRLTAPAPAHDPATVAGGAGPAFALGVPERQATWAWWQAGRAWAAGADVNAAGLAHTVRRIGELDPAWRTPWVYGGLMLQALGRTGEAEDLLEDGATRWPDDPWFPAALGVHLQDQGRIDEARRWLRAARERS